MFLYMEKQYEHIVSNYSAMSREWNTLTLEEQMEYTGGRFLCAKKNTKEPSLRLLYRRIACRYYQCR